MKARLILRDKLIIEKPYFYIYSRLRNLLVPINQKIVIFKEEVGLYTVQWVLHKAFLDIPPPTATDCRDLSYFTNERHTQRDPHWIFPPNVSVLVGIESFCEASWCFWEANDIGIGKLSWYLWAKNRLDYKNYFNLTLLGRFILRIRKLQENTKK